MSPLPTNHGAERRLDITQQTESVTKKTISNGSFMKKLFCLTTLLCFAVGNINAQMITEIHKSGFMFAHSKTVWLRQGTWHLIVNTSRNSDEDIKILSNCAAKLSKTCDSVVERNYRISCNNIVTSFQWNVEYTKHKIVELQRHRSKRSRGILTFLQDLLFGNSEREEIEEIHEHQQQFAKKSSGILQATLESVDKIQNNTNERLQIFNDKINEVIKYMNHDKLLADHIFMEVQFLHTLEAAKAILDNIWIHYQRCEDISIITEKELRTLITKIQNNVPVGSNIPNVFHQQENLHLCHHEIKFIDQFVMLEI